MPHSGSVFSRWPLSSPFPCPINSFQVILCLFVIFHAYYATFALPWLADVCISDTFLFTYKLTLACQLFVISLHLYLLVLRGSEDEFSSMLQFNSAKELWKYFTGDGLPGQGYPGASKVMFLILSLLTSKFGSSIVSTHIFLRCTSFITCPTLL